MGLRKLASRLRRAHGGSTLGVWAEPRPAPTDTEGTAVLWQVDLTVDGHAATDEATARAVLHALDMYAGELEPEAPEHGVWLASLPTWAHDALLRTGVELTLTDGRHTLYVPLP